MRVCVLRLAVLVSLGGATRRGLTTTSLLWHKLPRLHVDHQVLSLGKDVQLDEESSHYLLTVMRMRVGSSFRVFNGRDGEFGATLSGSSGSGKRERKQLASVNIAEQLRSPHPSSSKAAPVHLYFAPLKKQRVKLLLEKATELGVDRLFPVQTQNTNERWATGEEAAGLARVLVESAEQCERLSVPALDKITSLADLLQAFPASQPESRLLVCRERSPESPSLLGALQEVVASPAPARCLLVGPEGGFTAEELQTLARLDFVRFVSLGDSVLRAETAAIAALAVLGVAEHPA